MDNLYNSISNPFYDELIDKIFEISEKYSISRMYFGLTRTNESDRRKNNSVNKVSFDKFYLNIYNDWISKILKIDYNNIKNENSDIGFY